MATPPKGFARTFLIAAGFLGAYVLLDWVSYMHPMQEYSITPWNPQPALAIALLMKMGQRFLPVVLLAVTTAAWAIREAHGGLVPEIIASAALAFGYAAIAAALCSRGGIVPSLPRARDVLKLVAIVAAGTLVTGTLYIAALVTSGEGPVRLPFTALLRFWVGDAVGILVTLPLVLMLVERDRRVEFAALLRRRETALHFAVLAATAAGIMLVPAYAIVPYFYMLFLPLILVATRLGLCGATLAALAIQAAIIVSGEIAGYQVITIFELQALLIALTVTGLFLGVAVDERKRVEDELRRSMRLATAGEMAGALAHELNQPLTAVLSYSRAAIELARRGSSDRALLEGTLAKVAAEASRAADVLRKLRDFFRTGATELRDASIPALVAEAASAARRTWPSAVIEVRSAAPVPPVLADATQLGVVLRNLIANAVEAGAANGTPRVDLGIAGSGEGVLVRVQDNGHGVREDAVERIFEPFESTRPTGMGMGLAISRAIAEAHGGRLWAVASRHGDFRLWIPHKELQAHE